MAQSLGSFALLAFDYCNCARPGRSHGPGYVKVCVPASRVGGDESTLGAVPSVPFPRPLKLGDQGIDVEGLGRALCKTGFYVTLTQFGKAGQGWRRTYGQGKADAVNKLRAQQGWKRTGTYNEAVHDLMERKGFFDERAIDLISRYVPPLPPEPVRIRAAMTDFADGPKRTRTLALHPVKTRKGFGTAPSQFMYSDCSSRTACSCTRGRGKRPASRSPTRRDTTTAGYGNTWDDLDAHPRVVASVSVGDLAHYEGHVSICRKPGSVSEAIFSSFGSERGPHPTNRDYRSDLRFVCRPPFE